MPTPIMDLKGLSSPSYFSEDSCFPSEAQVTSCKSETLPDQYGTVGRKSFAAPPFQKFVSVDSETTKSMNRLEPFPVHHQKVNLNLDQEAVRAANGNRTASGTADSQTLSLLRSLDHKSGSVAGMNALQAPYFSESNRVNASVPPYENSLFSSSLPNLFSRKMKLSSRNTHFEHSVDTVPSHYDEGEPFTSLEEIEAQTIGNLLPDDDDLLSGVTDGLDFVMQPNGGDLEELDFFSNVGGMDLEDCDSSMSKKYIKPGSNGSTVGEHPYGENPSRTLFVRNINSNVEDSELRVLFEQYGNIRSLYTACKQRGFVMISYYDIRAARKAMESLQNRPMRGRRLDIHYSIPKDNPSDKEVNQGMLALSNLESSISNDELHHIFCAYGDVKEIQNIPHRNHQKLVEYFDIRAAEAAFRALNRSNIAGKQIKIEPVHPGGMKDIAIELEQDESDLFLQQSSPSSHSAPGFAGRVPLAALNSSSRENGTSLGMQSAVQLPFLGSPAHNGISSSVPDGLSSLLRVESAGRQSVLVDSGHSQGQLKFDIRGPANFHPHSLPEYQDSFVNGIPNSPNLMGTNFSQRAPETIDNRQLHRIGSDGHSLEQGVFGSAGSGSSPLTGHHFMWGNTYRSQAPGMMWPNSPSFVNGIRQAPSPARLHGLHGTPSPMLNTVLPTNNHHVGSAPAVNPTIWDRQQPYAVGSPETSVFHPGSLGNMRISKSTLHSLDFVPHNIFSHVGGNCVDLPISSKVMGLQSPHQRCMMYPGRGQIMPGLNSFDPPSERVRSRRNEGASSQADKKQYELDIERIIRGEDNRTTLMIKNIPNKYTSKMLLAAIDEQHRGTYDFIYLPIDFKNKCNVGYAFINMTDPNQIIPFYKAFNGKKWEKFNSEKVASLAYARIQGKSALIAHFQNSSLMNEDKRCRPILFNTEGPNAGDQVPFPMGVNVRSRPGKARSSSFEENHQGAIGGDSSNRDPSTSPTRDSE